MEMRNKPLKNRHYILEGANGTHYSSRFYFVFDAVIFNKNKKTHY
ncbi:hypothetical protein [Helicobacter sp. MIT 11-5569]|nr:hypothetical protein [Helicobacter sp. MIT 11-5569]